MMNVKKRILACLFRSVCLSSIFIVYFGIKIDCIYILAYGEDWF